LALRLLGADGGEFDVAGVALEQIHLQRCFELLDRPRQRRLIDEQLRRDRLI
jgi:hypothetical protein